MQEEEAILYDIVLKRAKRAVIAIPGKNGIERMLIELGDRKEHNPTPTTERLTRYFLSIQCRLNRNRTRTEK
jgi:hypothetical protein